MFPTLKEKVEAKFPQTFEEAQEIATVKFKKLLYQERKSNFVKEREEVNVPQHTNNAQPRVASISADSHQEDLLHKLTQQLETLTLNLVQAPTRGQQPRDDARPLRRSTQELRCWNCNETSHGMYHCPHPRRIPGDMYPPRRPPQTIQFDIPQQPPTILRRPPPPPQPMAAVPPVPEQPEERGVNIIKLEEPEELNVMPAIKRTRAQERDEEMKSDTSDEPKKGKKKVKEDEAESSKKKKSTRPRRVIGIDDFPLGKNLEPYDMVEDLKLQRPNITWPQLMHLSSSIRRQWPKLASTRIPKKRKEKVVKSIKSNTPKDIEPIVDAYIKGKRVSNVYVDGRAQMCVITERTMHRLGLSITEPSDCHAKLANNSKVKCLGIIKDVHITVLDVFAKVDFYVMPSKGEGYPLILGRPWLMEVNADQKWGSGKLVLQKGKRIVYDMKLGKQSNICFETSTDEESSDESSYGDEESYTSEESSMEVMGLVFQQPQAKGLSTSKEVEVVAKEEPMMEERLRKMLSKDLTKEEEEDYINMFKRYPHLFITDYSMIKGVDVIQHHIDLKHDAKPVAQKLRRLGVVQQEALFSEVNKLLKAGFIYPVTNSEWVSPVVVTPKKNGKWRVCVDYKPLNAATRRDHFPLPFQDEILNEVAGHERYTVCDGYSGYYQIRIAEEDQHKTTFITPWGCFAFRVMPFGLTNAPSTFTRFTSFIFQPFFGKSIRVFLDDFCTYSDRALHCQRVEEGLQRLYQYGGQLSPDKCHVAEKEVVLLGHVISQEGIKVDPSRVQAILDLPPPNSARQVITFVQKVRYMSRFIHLLSQIISPLQQLANQEVFSWEHEHLECFNEVKEVLGSLPTIMPPDPQEIYYLCPSVGLDAFGAVLMQKDPKTAYMQPVYFTSKAMTQGQKSYTDIEQLVFSLIVADIEQLFYVRSSLNMETTSSKEKLEQSILDLQRLELDREAATDYYITQANKKREQFNNKIKEKKLEERMLVMRYDSRLDLSHSKKFLQRWEGPYVIFKKFKNGSYRLQDLSGKIHKYPVNGWRLKEFFQRIQPIKEERQVSLDA
ncbi:hypothetical protein L7F22_043238 [Adiantum nelumboides]|nr:hypothetical protein [Adiantum nelumboides]